MLLNDSGRRKRLAEARWVLVRFWRRAASDSYLLGKGRILYHPFLWDIALSVRLQSCHVLRFGGIEVVIASYLDLLGCYGLEVGSSGWSHVTFPDSNWFFINGDRSIILDVLGGCLGHGCLDWWAEVILVYGSIVMCVYGYCTMWFVSNCDVSQQPSFDVFELGFDPSLSVSDKPWLKLELRIFFSALFSLGYIFIKFMLYILLINL